MMKILLAFFALLFSVNCIAQQNQAAIIARENAAADERRLQKFKEEGRKPNTPSNNGVGLSKEYWMEKLNAAEKAKKDYLESAEKVRRSYVGDNRPLYERREHIPGMPDDYVDITYANGATYRGGWKNWKYHGKGKLVSSNGNEYEGDFVKDKYHGKGTAYNRSDNNLYVGEFKNNEKSGQGMIRTKNYTFNGQFRNDRENGIGTLKDKEGNVYEGPYKNGLMHGKIKHLKNGEFRFEGNYAAGKKSGEGREAFADGSTYTGTYKVNRYHGKGKRTFANGDVYDGNFKDGLYDGKGRLVMKDGTVKEGKWAEGNFLTKQ